MFVWWDQVYLVMTSSYGLLSSFYRSWLPGGSAFREGVGIGYNTRTKRCATCKAASRNGYPSRKHDCRLNWTRSSKAMEPDVAAELAVYASEHGAPVAVLVGDHDSCTIKCES